ncbi:MAG: Ig-like domain repeat protein, partial [Clostridia bacterium]|nr:Ig-like domain repeat protein [Clostridia bacterium]
MNLKIYCLTVPLFEERGTILFENSLILLRFQAIKTLKPNTKITIEPLTFTAGELTTIRATVTASDNSIVTNGKVTFKINGKTLKNSDNKVVYVNVVDGVATAEYL